MRLCMNCHPPPCQIEGCRVCTGIDTCARCKRSTVKYDCPGDRRIAAWMIAVTVVSALALGGLLWLVSR